MISSILKIFKPFQSIWHLIDLHRTSEIKWSAPRQVKIAIYDAYSLEALVPLLGEKTYEVIFTRGEMLYITPGILWGVLINLVRVRHPFSAYLLTLIQHIRPAIVVTLVDNDWCFGKVAQHHKAARFLAIQNGMRCLARDNAPGTRPIYLAEFACFGGYEVDMYVGHGVKGGTFYPIGSLRDSYYREYYAESTPSIKYDLCLVSEVDEALPQLYPEIEGAIRKLAVYLAAFCERTNKKICIAARSDPDENRQAYLYERQWYREQMGEWGNLIPNNRQKYSTYHLIDSSAVSLSFYSTALVEAFGRGRRSLFCNFSDNVLYDLPEMSAWTLESCSYEAFEERLLSLLEMNDEEFQKKSSRAASYMMNYNKENPPHVFLRKLLAEAVNK